MNTPHQTHPFPFNNFPDIFRNAYFELINNVKCPPPLVAGELIAAASLACQFHVKVVRLDGREGPCHMFIVVIAESGERKSTIDSLVFEPFHRHDSEQIAKFSKEKESFKISHRIWSTEYRGLSKRLEKMTEKGVDTEAIKAKLENVAQNEPRKPRMNKTLYTDVTPEALAFGMHDCSSSVGLISAEAGGVFGSTLTNNFPLLNSLWDGGPVRVDRRSSESFTLTDVQATISLLTQPKPFQDLIAKKGDNARGSGFFARALIASPESTQGTRFRDTPTLSWEHLPVFHARLDELIKLQDAKEVAGVPPGSIVLKFSPETQVDMIKAYNHVEQHIKPGGFYADAKDYASKIIENTVRLAAIFHYFSGQPGDISLDTFRAAEKIVTWYAEEFVRLFAPSDPVSEVEQEAQVLEQWFVKLYRQRGWNRIQKSFIRKYGPNSLRNKERLDWALVQLAATNRVVLFMMGKTNYVDMNMAYFNSLIYGPAQDQRSYFCR